ncbi:magnesium and cobalt transport protein CorA [Millisia brevis]|uniref:magnesium and cobalt transport protein CorA n=1 Tax=Millisia brevis TaxID=264148 RepID=UPI0008357AFE
MNGFGRLNRKPPAEHRSPLEAIPVPAARAVIDCAVYIEGLRLPGTFTYRAALAEVRRRGEGFVWLGLLEPDARQMMDVAETFGLHELVVEDVVQAHQRPKLERYDDLLFLVLRTINYIEHDAVDAVSEIVQTGELMVLCAPDFVVTVRHGEHSGLGSLRKSLEATAERLAQGPTTVMHAIADMAVDRYLTVVEAMAEDVAEIEEKVFGPRGRIIPIDQSHMLKRELIEFRRAVAPLDGPLRRLLATPDLVPKAVRRYFRDVADHQATVTDRIAELDETLNSMISAAMGRVAMAQNEDMRKISAWVAIAAVPTMMAGIYGMNFENMPELSWHYGYFTLLSIMFSACLLLFVTFRRNHWL